MNHKVLVTPHLLQSDDGPHFEPLSSAGLEIVYPPQDADTLDPDVIRTLLTPDIGAILASTEPLTAELMAQTQLRVVARLGVGYDSIDVQAATELGIAVTITPGTLEDSVAEQTFALLLGLNRDVIGRDHEVRVGVWKREPMPRLAGRTFGVIGCGRIGRAVVPRALGFQMKVVVYDPQLDAASDVAPHVTRVESLEALLRVSDVVSLHVPCVPATENLINAESISQMKPGAVLINTSRGGLVDEEALYEALQSGQLSGAGLDVFKQEPLPIESPLLDCQNVVTSTHVGGIDLDTIDLAGRLSGQCIADLFTGSWPNECLVNPSVKDRWQWTTRETSAE